MSGRSTSSWVWKDKGGFFVKTSDGKARCTKTIVLEGGVEQECGHVMAVNTGHMGSHLSNVHRFTESEWAEERSKGMQQGMNAFLVGGKVILSREELQEQQRGLGLALANSLAPISMFEKKPSRTLHCGDSDETVERWDLNSWLFNLLPQFKPGEYHTIQSRVNDEVTRLDADVRYLLSRMIGIGLTSDGFSSDANLHFHSLTAHGVLILRNRMFFVSLLLADEVFPESDAETESQWILKTLDHWGVGEAQRAGLTIDGAMRATARLTRIPWLWCPGHWLQLGIHDVTEWPKLGTGKVPEERLGEYPKFQHQVWEIIDKTKRTVAFFSTPKKWGELQAIHEQLKLPDALKSLKQDQATRWSSEFSMMESVLESQKQQDEWYRNHYRYDRIMFGSDFKICSEMCFILSAPKRVTLRRQTWDFPCGLDVWPDFFRCIEFWLSDCPDSTITTALAREFRDGLIKSVVDRARVFLQENEKLNFAMMGMSSYFWTTSGASWRISTFWDEHYTTFSQLLPGVSGPTLTERVFANFVGCVQLRAPSTLAACCGGLYVEQVPSIDPAEAQAGSESWQKRSKTALDRLFEGPVADAPSDFCEEIPAEARKFIHLIGSLASKPILAACENLVVRRECPRCVHTVLYHMGICGSNAPSESTFSDTNFVTSDRRGRTSAGWAEAQVKVHRNYDMVKKLRAIAGAGPGQSLEDVWEMK